MISSFFFIPYAVGDEKEIYTGLLWLIIALGPLLFLQRALHREIQSIFLMVTRREDVTMVLFSILFFPGVLLHEGSHYLTARLLGVRTGRFSILPKPLPNSRLQLGYVETAGADPLREALIGAAPLLAGGLFVAFAGINRLALPSLWIHVQDGGLATVWRSLPAMTSQPDFWLWFYLLFTVSSTMLPSASDRRAWLPLALAGALLLGISLLAGAGPWLFQNLAPWLTRLFNAAAAVFFMSDFAHVAFFIPAFILEKLLLYVFFTPFHRVEKR